MKKVVERSLDSWCVGKAKGKGPGSVREWCEEPDFFAGISLDCLLTVKTAGT